MMLTLDGGSAVESRDHADFLVAVATVAMFFFFFFLRGRRRRPARALGHHDVADALQESVNSPRVRSDGLLRWAPVTRPPSISMFSSRKTALDLGEGELMFCSAGDGSDEDADSSALRQGARWISSRGPRHTGQQVLRPSQVSIQVGAAPSGPCGSDSKTASRPAAERGRP